MAELFNIKKEGSIKSKKADLDDMPPEVLETIYKSTDGDSSVALMLSSKGFLEKLDNSKQFWKHIATCNNLDNDEWKENNFEDTAMSWKTLYLKLKRTHTRLISQQNLETSRIFLDLQNRIEASSPQRDTVAWQHVEEFESKVPRQKEAVKTFQHCSEDSVGQNIFGSSLSEKYMVVFVSKLDHDVRTKLFVWNVENNISFAYAIENHQICQQQIRCEEVLVWEHFLIKMGLVSGIVSDTKMGRYDNDMPLIEVYDLRSPCFNIAASFYLKGLVSTLRFLVEKEEGGQKLLVWNNKLLVVSPEIDEKGGEKQILALHLLDLEPLISLGVGGGQIILEELWSKSLDNVAIDCPFSFFAIDQKGPAFVLAINEALSNQCLAVGGQQFIYLNLDVNGQVFFKLFKGGDIERALSDVKIPVFGTYQIEPYSYFELDPNITSLRLECLIATSDKLSKFGILTTDGTIVTYEPNQGFSSFRPITDDYVDIDTYSDELHIYHDKIIVMKIFQNPGHEKKRLTYLTTFEGDLLWKVDNSTVLDPNQRFFLSPMFNFIFISSADSVAVYDLNNGNLVAKLQYPEMKKHRVSVSEDLYAQSGYSVWDLRSVCGRIVVTHDIERANPVIADWINIL